MTKPVIKVIPSSIAFVLLLFVGAQGQTNKANRTVHVRVNIAEQFDSPIQVAADSVKTSSSPDTAVTTYELYLNPPGNVMLRLENTGEAPVAAYAIVSKGTGFHNVQVQIMTKPFRPGDLLFRGFGTSGSEDIEYSLDYVLFTNGTSWGPDRYGRSIQIASYFEGRNAALEELSTLSAAYPDPQDFLDIAYSLGGYISHDPAGEPNPETINKQYRNAWTHVIDMLRNSSRRQKESKELADKLEAAIPAAR